jgi:hypothetical protein
VCLGHLSQQSLSELLHARIEAMGDPTIETLGKKIAIVDPTRRCRLGSLAIAERPEIRRGAPEISDLRVIRSQDLDQICGTASRIYDHPIRI